LRKIARLRARIGVPATVAGLAVALDKYGSGKFTLADLLKPAIALAKEALTSPMTSPTRCRTGIGVWRAGRRRPKIFSRADGTSLREGDRLVSDRSRGDAFGDCRAGSARILRRTGRQKLVKANRRRGGTMNAGRSQILSAGHSRAGARHLSRI